MNTLYQGDNLAILRSLPDACVDLICVDTFRPPVLWGKQPMTPMDTWVLQLTQL